MNPSVKLKKMEEYIRVMTVYYMNLLLDKDLPDFKKSYLQGRIEMLNTMNKEFFDGNAKIDF